LSNYSVISWPDLVGGWIDPIRDVGMERESLENAAHLWLEELGKHPRLAVIDVVLGDAWAAADLLGT
jgi:hypothetical protein